MSTTDSTDPPQIEIKHRGGGVLFVSRASSVRDAVQEALKSGAYLSGANLSGANLSGANLSGANLSRADLSVANLSGANLSGAYLYRADLSGANLSGANLSGANLSGANLSGAYLSGAYLSGANLSGANLSGANLSVAYLSGAYLSGANLSVANLSGANLSGANLYRADLSGADLSGANLSGATNAEYAIAKTRIIPDEGDITGWKQARYGRIVKLRILDGAKRSHGSGRKCRTESAVVLAIFNKDGKPVKTAVSQYDETFKYKVGDTITPREPFCDDMWQECASGIHFFITRIEAENYA